MTISQFQKHWKLLKNLPDDDDGSSGRAEWKRMEDDGYDTKGAGVNKQIWVPVSEQRFRDRKVYINQAVEESSQQLKNPDQKDVNCLKQFANRSAPSHGDAFFGEQRLLLEDARASLSNNTGTVCLCSRLLPPTSTPRRHQS